MSLPCFFRTSHIGLDIADIGFVAIGLTGLTGSTPEQAALNAILFSSVAVLLAGFGRTRLRIMLRHWLPVACGLLTGFVTARFQWQFALSGAVVGAPERKPSLARSAPNFADDIIRLDLAWPYPSGATLRFATATFPWLGMDLLVALPFIAAAPIFTLVTVRVRMFIAIACGRRTTC